MAAGDHLDTNPWIFTERVIVEQVATMLVPNLKKRNPSRNAVENPRECDKIEIWAYLAESAYSQAELPNQICS